MDNEGSFNQPFGLEGKRDGARFTGTSSEREAVPQLVIPFADGKSVGDFVREWKMRRNAPRGGVVEMMSHPTFLNEAEKQIVRYRAIGMIAANGVVIPQDENGDIPDDLLVATLTQLPEKVRQKTAQALRPSPAPVLEDQLRTVRVGLEQETPQLSEEEAYEQKITELARRTRAEGMGYLDGKFPRTLETGDHGNFQIVGGFIQGTELDKTSESLSYLFVPEEYSRNVLGYHTHPDRRVWTVKPYKSDAVVSPHRLNGKTGLETGVQYSYGMLVSADYDGGGRQGVIDSLNVVVPKAISEIIENIDLEQYPDFPDRYFQALYPGRIGPDTATQIRRLPATELLVRKNGTEEKVIQFPTPMPY